MLLTIAGLLLAGNNILPKIKVVKHFSTPQTKQHLGQRRMNKLPVIEVYI